VASLVKFQALADIEPRQGILFFGLVVVFTMLSAMSFDPRLIWDKTRNEGRDEGQDKERDQVPQRPLNEESMDEVTSH
jgi:paraquat-inducible protein A